MRHIAAYLLATLGGNDQPSASDIKKILSSVGIEADDEQLKRLLNAVGGKDISKLISEGLGKLATVPSGNASVSAAPVASATGAKKEEPKKVEQKNEDSEGEMGFGLFD